MKRKHKLLAGLAVISIWTGQLAYFTLWLWRTALRVVVCTVVWLLKGSYIYLFFLFSVLTQMKKQLFHNV